MKDLYCLVLKHHDCLGLLELALGDFPVLALPLVNLATGENTTFTPKHTYSKYISYTCTEISGLGKHTHTYSKYISYIEISRLLLKDKLHDWTKQS